MAFRVQRQQTHQEIVNFTGGLNEQVANLELKSGELTSCQNYVERDDIYGGYESIEGYERFDGQTKPSSIPASEEDDIAREAARAAITPVPGTGQIRGIWIFNDEIYATRDEDTDPLEFKQVYVETASGWSQVTELADLLNSGGTVRTITDRFTSFNSGNSVLCLVDGVSDAQLIYDVAGTLTVTSIPEPDTDLGYPTHVAAFKNRLILIYPKGNLVFSVPGDPSDYDTATNFAGRVKVGGEITGIQETTGGALVITTLTDTHMLYYGGTSDDETWIYKLDTFSKSLGAYPDTMKGLLGTTMFADVAGITTLLTANTYGDFRESNLSKKVQTSYDHSKILAAVTQRARGRYFLYFSDHVKPFSYALCVSMRGGRVKSITKITHSVDITYITNVNYSDGAEKIFFGSNTGYVFEEFSGTSFDGAPISSLMSTASYHYKSPRVWKRFSKIYFEASGKDPFTVAVSPRYNYNSATLPEPSRVEYASVGGVSIWGDAEWNDFIWSRGELKSLDVYLSGIGSNMGVYLQSRSKYARPHIIYNMQVSYTLNTQQL